MGRLTEFYESILYENELQNPQISRKTLRLSPERPTLVLVSKLVTTI
jgi:hypothetical protein